MPYIDINGHNKGWSMEPQPDLGLVDYVENIPDSTVIPSTVSAAQGGIALIRAGLMDAIQDAVNAEDTPAEVKWAFDKAQEWSRDSLSFNYLADKARLSQQQRDELFSAAAQVSV